MGEQRWPIAMSVNVVIGREESMPPKARLCSGHVERVGGKQAEKIQRPKSQDSPREETFQRADRAYGVGVDFSSISEENGRDEKTAQDKEEPDSDVSPVAVAAERRRKVRNHHGRDREAT